MRHIRPTLVAVVSLAILAVVGWPGETIRRMGGNSGEPWRPPGRGTPSIDILGETPYFSDLFGNVVVTNRGPGVAALRLTDGTESWVYQRSWGGDLVDWLRVDDRHISVVWRDGRVTLIDVPTGRVVWRTDLPDGPSAEANRAFDEEWASMWELSMATPGTLVILHDGRVDVLDSGTGTIQWTYQSPLCGPIDRVKGAGEVVLVNLQCAEPHGLALATKDGSRWWTFTDDAAYATRELGQGRLVSIEKDGGLVVRRAADGKVLWRDPAARLDDNFYVDFLGVSAELLTADTPRGIVAYRIADGRIAWRRPLDRAPKVHNAVLTDGRVTYVAADQRTLLKLDARTGHVIDRHEFPEEILLRAMRDDLAVVTTGFTRNQIIG